MILSRFLKPKWQQANPEARKQSLRNLDSRDPKLLDLAQRDPDPTVRRAALEQIDDLDLLQRTASENTDPDIRNAFQEHYHALWAGKAANSPSLASRLERLKVHLDNDLIDFLLRHATEPELRLAALQRIELEAVLADIAIQNSYPDLRLIALERVQDPELLDRIARQSRNRDKRLYRRARERLDALNAAQARTLSLERLCTEMEQLNWDGESGTNAGRFPKLEQEWRAQEANAPSEFQARYAQARDRFLAERQLSANRRTQRLELLATLDALLERLHQHNESNPELDAAIHHAITEIPAAWVPGATQDIESRRQETQFQQRIQDIQEQERVLQRNHIRAERLRKVLVQGDALLHEPGEMRDTDLKQLRQRWEGLERPEVATLATDLQNHFDSLLDKLRARKQRQVQRRDQEWQDIQERVSQLEVAIGEGELQQAIPLLEQTRQQLKDSIDLSRGQIATIEERLQTCTTQIGELRGWRRWGTSQAREQLCRAAENLIDLEADPADIAQRIQQTRAAWKALDQHEGGAPKGLWKRFNDACERAYAPCQTYFENQIRERQQNLDQKLALCEQLEQFEATTDWQQVDWREADRLRRRAQTQWHQLGPVNRADRKTLDRRFQQILQRLDSHLDGERDHERQRRQQLIEQVQALVDTSDLRAAIEIAKHAQAQWQPTVQSSHRQEQALWKAFRSACDAVFARRQAEQEAADAERQTNLARKLELCGEIEALALISREQLAQADTRLQALQQEWQTIGSIPKAEQRVLDQRFEAAIQQFIAHEKLLRQTDLWDAFQHLYQRNLLCARLESRLETQALQDDTMLSSAHQEWITLAELPTALAAPLQQRFDAICTALAGTPEQMLAAHARLELNLKRKQIWCVCMEIVAGVDSPPEFTQLRMEYQVARLSASLAGTAAKTEALYDPQQLQEQWCLTGALPTSAVAELDTRFLHAVQIWWQREES